MKTLRKQLKVIAVFLLLNTVNYLFFPIVSLALTSGPTNPDYTSFEPVDASDMVDLLTGDLTYTMPLLEVPGPAGSYPISLAYHSGIQVNQEASWVGLGWTLNPGAVNRSVNGHPDDHKNVTSTTRLYWEGGKITERKIGVSVGLPGDMVSVSAGATFAHNTYTNQRGVGGYGGVGLSHGNMNIGLQASYNPVTGFNGGTNATVGIGYSTNQFVASAGIGMSSSFNGNMSAGLNGGVTARANGVSLGNMGASITSSGFNYNGALAGYSASVYNNKAGDISSSNSHFGISIPIPLEVPLWINLAKNTYRFWSDESENVVVNGAMYFEQSKQTPEFYNNRAYDTYSLVDDELLRIRLDDPNITMGGTFVEYDQYQVTGQGISGSMRPYHYKQHVAIQNDDNKIINQPTGFNFNKPHFRFEGDFSNRHIYESSEFNDGFDDGGLNYDFGWGNSITGITGDDGFVNGQLVGSREIQTFTNEEILNSLAHGFLENRASGFERSELDPNQIGAFIITNESGVSYHYTLPAYSFNEYQESSKIDDVENFNNLRRPEKYAYTWHLTAVTGPDFVDRGEIGKLDSEDWGYWVDFNYGKWTENYQWRNPGTGYHKDIDGEFQNFSTGTKEIYYLDAISTKTHTALFIKVLRDDNRSIAVPDYRSLNPYLEYSHENASFNNQVITAKYSYGYEYNQDHGAHEMKINPEKSSPDNTLYTATKTYSIGFKSIPTLKLSEILLVENQFADLLDDENINLLKDSGIDNSENEFSSVACSVEVDMDFDPDPDYSNLCASTDDLARIDAADVYGERGFNYRFSNVLDYSDPLENYRNKSIRSIKFDTDYSLAYGVDNSWTESGEKSGKLSLKGVSFMGKGGTQIIPSTRFEYEIEDREKPGKISGTLLTVGVEIESEKLKSGDLINVFSDDGSGTYLVKSSPLEGSYVLSFVGGDNVSVVNSASGSVRFEKTKNPMFSRDHYDVWGMYKADVNPEIVDNGTLKRLVSEVSSKNLDVWSLRNIKTPLGSRITISYESDTYNKVAFVPSQIGRISNAELDGQLLRLKISDLNIIPKLEVGDYIYITLTMANIMADAINWSVPENGKFKEPDFKPYHKTYDSGLRTLSPHTYELFTQIDDIDFETGIITIDDSEIVNIVTGDFSDYRYDIMYELINGVYQESDESEIVNTKFDFTGWPRFTLGGYFSLPMQDEEFQFGGGIRTKSISIINENIKTSSVYSYQQGTTSYEPYQILPPNMEWDGEGEENIIDWAKNQIKRGAYVHYNELMKNPREILAPGVLYQTVDVNEFIGEQKYPGTMRYEFVTIDPNMIQLNIENESVETESRDYYGIPYQKRYQKSLALKNYSAGVGSLKHVFTLDDNEKILQKVTHNYLSDFFQSNASDEDNNETYEDIIRNEFNNQGVLQEVFVNARFVRRGGVDSDKINLIGTISKREHYPHIKTGTTTINYKTGTISESKILKYNMYSGQPIRSVSINALGEAYLTESNPAFNYYSQMGPKGLDSNNKNMLTQIATLETYRVDLNDYDTKLGLVSATAQSWDFTANKIDLESQYIGLGGEDINLLNPYRKRSTFKWVGRTGENNVSGGFYDPDFFNSKNLYLTETEPGWQKVNEITLYDVYSNALEAKDINGNYAATKMDAHQERVLASAANASYNEFTYSSFENDGDGDLLESQSGIALIESDYAHTGNKVMSSSGEVPLLYVFDNLPDASERSNHYVLSYWISNTSPGDIRPFVESGGPRVMLNEQYGENKKVEIDGRTWYQQRAIFEVDELNNSVNIGLETLSSFELDDFRIQPLDAVVTGYVYNEWGELSAILDNNNLSTRYEYDAMGKLKSVHKETFQYGINKVSEQITKYKRASN